jgi:hypothetical protein
VYSFIFAPVAGGGDEFSGQMDHDLSGWANLPFVPLFYYDIGTIRAQFFAVQFTQN